MQQLHIVRIFVFRQLDRQIDYLVVRHQPAHDSFWSPVTGVLQPHESLFQAAVRSVGEEIGLPSSRQIVDLQLATRTTIGDIEEIDWSVGYRAPENRLDLRPAADLAELRWLHFDGIYQNLDREEDRRSIMRLHFTLRAAG
ncbi:MAG: NUDIX hydrolase [Planctomycetota bacterium]|jgi:ADP-ribose pyrophosphatase YjhB (NUDIX family)